MNLKSLFIVSMVVTVGLAGCTSSGPAPASSPAAVSTPAAVPAGVKVAYEPGSVKKGDKGHCVVCVVKNGKAEGEEEVAETINYQGKTYVFCNESEKAEFISNPGKYAVKP